VGRGKMGDAEWSCIERLFQVFDRQRTGKLNLDQLVNYVAEVRKMDIVPIDEAYIVAQLQEGELEEITYAAHVFPFQRRMQ
jgi:Ca2+-binding EF-hand superfamily protein